MINILFAIVAFILLVGFVVTIHEGGHFITALLCRIKILEFSIGFGPILFQRSIGKDKILFTLRILPMGGFVKPLDKNIVTEEYWNNLTPQEQNRSFSSVSRWKKALMVAGGPLSNFILASILFFGIFYTYGSTGINPVVAEISQGSIFYNSGIKPGDEIKAINDVSVQLNQDTYSVLLDSIMNHNIIKMTVHNDKEGTKNYLINTKNVDYNNLLISQFLFHGLFLQGQTGDIVITDVKKNGSAQLAGIQGGDIILSFDGQAMNDISKSIRYIQSKRNSIITVKVLRDNVEKTFEVPVESKKNENIDIGVIGIYTNILNPTNITTLKYSFLDAVSEGISSTILHTRTSLSTIEKLALGQISTKAISGPLSIAEYSGTSLQMGLKYFLQMMALISIAIGVFNLMPIPMLDGGHLFQYFIESIRGKNYNSREILLSNYVGIICLIGIFTLAMGNDLIRYVQMIG